MKICAWASLFAGTVAMIAACTIKEEDDGSSSSSKAATSGSGASSASSASAGGNVPCEMRPTYQECAECLCDGDDVGCGAHLSVVGMHYFCGQSCATSCTAFCASQDDADIDEACNTCADSIDCQGQDLPPEHTADCQAASQACQADANCQGFLVKLQMCPP